MVDKTERIELESSRTPQKAPTKTLFRRTLVGGLWAVGGFGASNVLRLASNLLLTRLLAPEAFGLMAMANTLLAWFQMLSDLGVRPSIIRSASGEERTFIDTAWTVEVVRSLVVAFAIMLLTLGLVSLREMGTFDPASVYADERLPVFLVIIAFVTLITGLRSVAVIIKERRLQTSYVVGLEFVQQIVTIGSIIALVLVGVGPYALVVGTALGVAAATVGSYVAISGPHGRLGFERRHFNEIFNYGKWLMIASSFGFLVNRGDQVLFGYLVGKVEFSLYAIAAIWITTARGLFQNLQQRVAYPLFSEVSRKRPHDLTSVYYRLRLVLDATSMAAFITAYFGSEPFFRLLYAESYHGVGAYARLMSVSLLLVPYDLLNVTLLSSGDSRRFTAITVVPGIILFVGIPLVFNLAGFEAAILFGASIRIFAVPLTWNFARRVVHLNWLRESAMIVVTLGVVMAMALR